MELRLRLIFILVIVTHQTVARDIRSLENTTIIDLCENTHHTVNNIECFCKNTIIETKPFVFKAECNIDNENIPEDDKIWKSFTSISTIESLVIDPKKNKVLTYIPTRAFKVLRYLLKATIQHGNVHTVHAFAFANHTSIQEIKLSRNGIKDIAINAFAHHPSLMSLTLDNNNIEEIKRNSFRRLPKLEHLYLTNNNISIIHDRAFLHLGGLKGLELDKNSIFVLTNETFTGLANLRTLQLSYNNIEVIGENTFQMLENLHTLHLGYNKIRLLDDGALRGLEKLESLMLSNNKIKQLTSSTLFLGLPSLVVLELRSNGMHEFSVNAIEPILSNFYKDGSSIDVDGNKFPCDCNLNWLLNIRKNTINTYLQKKVDNLMCYPSKNLAEDFKKYEESEKSKSTEEEHRTEIDYEYYDDKSMDGKLFFSDIPHHLVPCDRSSTSLQQIQVATASEKSSTATESITASTTAELTIQTLTTAVTSGPLIYSTTREQKKSPTTVKTTTTPPIVTTTFAETTTVLNPRIPEVSRYIPAAYSHRTTQASPYTQPNTKDLVTDSAPPMSITNANKRRTEYSPSHQTRPNQLMENVVPTEDMVSDGNGDSTLAKASTIADLVDKRYEKMIIDEEYNIRTKGGEVPIVHKTTTDQQAVESIVTVNDERKSPETMSHVHEVSSANKNILPVLAIYIPISLFICLHLKL